MNTRERAEEIKIKSTGTKKYPYYVIYEGKNELCHTIDIDNAKRIVKAIECLASLPIVTDEEINIIEFISEWPYEDDFVSQNIQMSMSYGYASDNSLELAREWRKQYKGLLEILSRLHPVGKTDKLPGEQGAPFDEGIK